VSSCCWTSRATRPTGYSPTSGPELGHLTSWPAWPAWRDTVVTRYRKQGQDCLLHAVITRLGHVTPGGQAVVAQLMCQWQGEIATGIRDLQAAGEVSADLDADRTAAAILAGIQGGVLMMISTGDLAPLEAALDMSIEYLRSH
jgi:hypothetical protein